MPRSSPRAVVPAIGVLAAAVLLHAAHAVGLPLPGPTPDVLYHGIEWGAIALCVWRAMHHRAERTAWLVLAAGLALFALGDLYYTLVLEKLDEPPFPSLADAFYLGVYPFAYVALVLMVRARSRRLPMSTWVDGVITALTFGAIGAALLVPAVQAETGGPVLTVATNVAYPLGDILLLSLVLGVALLGSWRVGRTWALLAAALVTFAGVDAAYLVLVADGSYQVGGLLDTGWPAAFALFAIAAWQPARRLTTLRLDRWGELVVPTLCAGVSLALLIYDHFVPQPITVLVLASLAVAAVVVRLLVTFGDNLRMLRRTRAEAVTDALTGLPNRRALLADLDEALAGGTPHVLAIYDLDGFKDYNDRYGHPAGDALLVRLGNRAATGLDGHGQVYRMGGDEFCVLAPRDGRAAVAPTADAFTEHGEKFSIGCSYGAVRLPDEAATAAEALGIADRRMYSHKEGGRTSAGQQSLAVLVQALLERSCDLGHDLDDLARLARETGLRLGLDKPGVAQVVRAARLHDVGKLAIPESILDKPGPLDDDEWDLVRRHTLIGERILLAAPALADVAGIVRASHERVDGNGYPDRLAGEQIPIAARIVAVCDAYDAMTTDRAYREALSAEAAIAELRRCAGTQFDPRVVEAFRSALAESGPAGGLLVGALD